MIYDNMQCNLIMNYYIIIYTYMTVDTICSNFVRFYKSYSCYSPWCGSLFQCPNTACCPSNLWSVSQFSRTCSRISKDRGCARWEWSGRGFGVGVWRGRSWHTRGEPTMASRPTVGRGYSDSEACRRLCDYDIQSLWRKHGAAHFEAFQFGQKDVNVPVDCDWQGIWQALQVYPEEEGCVSALEAKFSSHPHVRAEWWGEQLLAMVWLGLKLLTLLALCKQHTDRWPDQKVLLLSCCRLGLMRELTASHSRQMLLMANSAINSTARWQCVEILPNASCKVHFQVRFSDFQAVGNRQAKIIVRHWLAVNAYCIL